MSNQNVTVKRDDVLEISVDGLVMTAYPVGLPAPVIFMEWDDNGVPILYVWADKDGEDYTHKIRFDKAMS